MPRPNPLFALPLSCLLVVSPACAQGAAAGGATESRVPESGLTTEGPAIAAEASDEWIVLFDGGDIADHWRGYRQEGVPDGWSVVDGALTRTGGAGDLITNERFAEFEFHFEFKVADRTNSGVFFWGQELDGHPLYRSAPEYQVLDNIEWNMEWNDPHAVGAGYALYPCTEDATRPVGEWNQGVIKLHDNVVEHWLNGVMVCTYTIGSDDWNQRVADSKFNDWPEFAAVEEGHLGLQDHGDWVAYRSLRVRRLDD